MKIMRWVGLIVLVGLAYVGWRYYQIQSAAVRWEGPVKEILSEKFDKQANTTHMEYTSRIDAPVEEVFRAFQRPEDMQKYTEVIRSAKLLESEDNRKVIEVEAVILGQPQQMTLDFTFLPQEHRILMKGDSSLAAVEGEYRLTPSPDGTKTLLTYTATSEDKVNLPMPVGTQKSAARELFASTIRALNKGLAAQSAGGESATAQPQ